ncbi:MAG: hypothetical protein LAT63_17515, partial [Marinobacter sp.]|nr:hypothetical protein [Marinobacter sp.]
MLVKESVWAISGPGCRCWFIGAYFVSGQVGSLEDGSPEPDFARQVKLAFENLKATLAAGGCTFDDIVDVTTFHTDPENQLETIM